MMTAMLRRLQKPGCRMYVTVTGKNYEAHVFEIHGLSSGGKISGSELRIVA
jgi:hypothetical protein